MISFLKASLIAGALGLAALTAGCNDQQVKSEQKGYRGTAMAQLHKVGEIRRAKEANQLPESIDKVDPSGTPSGKSSLYQNVKVLGDVDENEFIRLMTAMTAWVSPEQGCAYCHNVENMADDGLYTKVVARRMLQMTRAINTEWKTHVGATGVTCYTCHRGMPVPNNIWFHGTEATRGAQRLNGYQGGQVMPLTKTGGSSLPSDPFTPYLEQANSIRVASTTALPTGQENSIQSTDKTYALMMHFSTSLGVNCTFCHNTENFASWALSTPQRGTAWYGIRMVRSLNLGYLDPLQPVWPANRLGPLHDGPKLNCATCHQGVNKPLLGQSMIGDWPELAVAGQ